MKNFKTIIMLVMVGFILIPSISIAESDWEFRFFGVNMNDLRDRDWKKVTIGAVSYFAVHELGHMTVGSLCGMNPSVDWSGRSIYAHGYDDKSSDQKVLFHSGGFIAGTIVGSILTAIPATRHSDFAVGFTGAETINDLAYGSFGGTNDDISDVGHINEVYGGNTGNAIAITSGSISSVLTYINLNKVKE